LKDRLAAAHGSDAAAIEIVVIKTTGDAILDRPLSEAGGKGLFTKELDIALSQGDVDIAVHSAKDLPTLLPDDIAILGYLPREDVRDAWISPHAIHPLKLRPGAVVGTASLRRGAMVKRLRPDLSVTLLRGNVETRLAKLAAGEVDATLLALAGLKRLNLESRATAILDPAEFVPAAGQGAIGITGRTGDPASEAFVAPVLDAATGLALAAERAFLHILDGSCKTPIGANARLEGGDVVFEGIVLRPDGSEVFEAALRGAPSDAAALGEAAGRDIRGRLPAGFFLS
jgi:hydroxymethylbilane synthase